MIGYIKGKLEYIGNGFVLIENNGIGYNIQVSSGTQAGLSNLKNEVKLYTYMYVKEDELSLIGFLSMDELNMFSLLITVSGVGPKGALSLLNTLTPYKISLAVITGDIKTLSQGQGIGKKIAQRIALELKDKIKPEDAFDFSDTDIAKIEKNDDPCMSEAVEALIALGFSRAEAVKSVCAVYEEGMQSSRLISLALKNINN